MNQNLPATLHVVATSPYSQQELALCLMAYAVTDQLLLVGDAVYGLVQLSGVLSQIAHAGQLYALEEDLQARNIHLPAGVKAINYVGFVELSIQAQRVCAW